MSAIPSEPVHRLFNTAQLNAERNLIEVYQNPDFQITGITVSKSGRLFVNFPRWSDRYLNAVVEVLDNGSVKPFPDESWNRWDMKPSTVAKQFVCVQSVVADDQDSLWVLDPAAPLLGPVIAAGAKLVRIDLASNQVTRVYNFGPDVVKPESYLNDIRIDTKRSTAYITDSGAGGIVVLDIESGKAHRALDGHPSVMAEQGINISVNGKPVVGPNGKPPQFNSDGIALSSNGDYLYYQALTGATIYRVKTSVLRESGASPDAAHSAVEQVAKTFPADGLWMDAEDRLYLSNINESAVYRLLKNGSLEKLVVDSRLQWPDTFSQGPDGSVYITASHINDAPQFNHGKSPRTEPYSVFRFMP
jgi:sugar lactone lactonase YvrE